MDAREKLLKRDEQRLVVLRAIYDLADGSEAETVPHDNIFAHLPHISEKEIRDALFFLGKEALIGGGLSAPSLTHAGVLEVESAIRSPERGTAHFRQVVIENHHHFYAEVAAVQTGDHNTVSTGQDPVGAQARRIFLLLKELAKPNQHVNISSPVYLEKPETDPEFHARLRNGYGITSWMGPNPPIPRIRVKSRQPGDAYFERHDDRQLTLAFSRRLLSVPLSFVHDVWSEVGGGLSMVLELDVVISSAPDNIELRRGLGAVQKLLPVFVATLCHP